MSACACARGWRYRVCTRMASAYEWRNPDGHCVSSGGVLCVSADGGCVSVRGWRVSQSDGSEL